MLQRSAEVPTRLAASGATCPFVFLHAAKIIEAKEVAELPSLREMRAKRPSWLVTRPVHLQDAASGSLFSSHLAVSHR